MAGDNNSKESNYWPGFVDALTNVVLVMVFIVVIFCSVIIGSIIKSANVKYHSAIEEKNKTINNLKDEISMLKSTSYESNSRNQTQDDSVNLCDIISYGNEGDTAKEKLNEPPVIIFKDNKKIVVSYALGVVKAEDKVWSGLRSSFDINSTNYSVKMIALPSEQSPTEGRRLSYYRLGILHDFFVKLGVKPRDIEHKILSNASSKKRSQVIITIERKVDAN
ncbi:TPA: hypothetical protein ACOEF8_004735 [Enterobacter roggenkampii]